MSTRGEDGFTLLELLVAMTLLGLLSLVLADGLRFGTRAWEMNLKSANNLNDIDRTEALFRREIDHAYPSLAESDDKKIAVDFDGSKSQMAFLAFGPDGTLHRVVFAVRGDGDRSTLVYMSVPEPSAAKAAPRPQTLLQNAGDVSFAYLAPADSAQHLPRSWVDAWRDRAKLPLAVRLDRGTASAIEAVPQIAASADCVFDVVLHDCEAH